MKKYLAVVGDKEFNKVFEANEHEAQFFKEIYEMPEWWSSLSAEFWNAYAFSLGGANKDKAQVEFVRKWIPSKPAQS